MTLATPSRSDPAVRTHRSAMPRDAVNPNPGPRVNPALLSDRELLGRLIGDRESRRLYKGSLRPIFVAEPEPGSPQEKCTVAVELVKRYLGEDLASRSILASPGAVRDYLRIALGSREHEVFVVIFLDGQHRVISVEE